MIVNYGKGLNDYVFALSFTATYACTAMLNDNAANYSCRIMTHSTLAIAYIHKGGSMESFRIIAVGY